MKFLILLGFLVVCILAGQSLATPTYHENVDDDPYDDEEDNVFTHDYWFEDDDHNLVRANLEYDEDEDETLEETLNDIDNRVLFYLLTRNNPTTPERIFINNSAVLTASSFNISNPVRFVTHGWVNSANSDACTLITNAYLEKGDYNVIVIDWSRISKRPYTFAQRRVKIVGRQVSHMLNFIERVGVDLTEVLLVGHSLGAHIVGLAGLYATNEVGSVVGLDPALPLFYFSSSGSRIAKGDARHVQIIHTNGGMLGIKSAIGDSDFYPNGGESQSGCWVDLAGACSHSRAYKYFAESINSERGFWGTECGGWRRYRWGRCRGNKVALMGGSDSLTSETGSFYFNTNSRRAYAKGINY